MICRNAIDETFKLTRSTNFQLDAQRLRTGGQEEQLLQRDYICHMFFNMCTYPVNGAFVGGLYGSG